MHRKTELLFLQYVVYASAPEEFYFVNLHEKFVMDLVLYYLLNKKMQRYNFCNLHF